MSFQFLQWTFGELVQRGDQLSFEVIRQSKHGRLNK